MIDFTKFFKLKKPDKDEFYDVALNNENMDIVDAVLEKLAALNATKAPLASPAFTGTATLGGKEMPTTESGTWTPNIYGSAIRGVWTPEAVECRWTLIGKAMILFIKTRGSLSNATGSIVIGGIPRAPQNNMGGGAVTYTIGLKATSIGNAGAKNVLNIVNGGTEVGAETINGAQITIVGTFEYEVI